MTSHHYCVDVYALNSLKAEVRELKGQVAELHRLVSGFTARYGAL